MADRIGAARTMPSTVNLRLHRDVGPLRRVEPVGPDEASPWLDGEASYSSLRRLVRVLDPLVMLANLGGYWVPEIVVAAAPTRSNKVIGITLPECLMGEAFRDPGVGSDSPWRVYTGLDFPAGASLAVGLRMNVERMLGTVYYDPGVAIDFTDPSVLRSPDSDGEFRMFDRFLLLTSPDATHLDDWLPTLGALVADDEGLRARLIADLVTAAHRVAEATTPVVPAGLLSIYAPSRWRPPRRERSAEEHRAYLDPFVRLGYAIVEHVLPDPDALGRFLVEETRLTRKALAAEGEGTSTAPAKISLRSRLQQIDATVAPRPRLMGLARRCEGESRRDPADPFVDLESWTVPRPGLRSVDLRLSYTEWLLVAAQLGIIDPVSAVGLEAAVADPANSRGMHPWLPGGASRTAMHLRGLASTAWMSWDHDRSQSIEHLRQILALIPVEPPLYDLTWSGLSDRTLTRDFPAMRSWTGAELDSARSMLEELISDQGAIDSDTMYERLCQLDLVLPGLDEYWLQTEPTAGPLDVLIDMAGEFGAGFAVGFPIPFQGDPTALASRLWNLHKANVAYLPLLSNVIIAGALYGAGEYVVTTINAFFDWLILGVADSILAIAELLRSSAWENGTVFGEATGLMAKSSAERLLAATTAPWYAFELGRLLGPLLLDLVLESVFAGYVVPRLTTGAALVLRNTVGTFGDVVDLRRVYSAFDRHDPDGMSTPDPGDGDPGSGGADGDSDPGGDGDPGSGGADGDSDPGGDGDSDPGDEGDPGGGDPDPDGDGDPDDGNGDGDGDGDGDDEGEEPGDQGPSPPIDPLTRMDQMVSAARASWIRTKLATKNRDRLFKLLRGAPEQSAAILVGLELLGKVILDDKVFQAVIRAYTTSDVKVGIIETLGRIERRTADGQPRPGLVPADFDLLTGVTAAQVQDEVLQVIARQADSYAELNELSSPMGDAHPGNSKDKLQDVWLENQKTLAARLLGEYAINGHLWDKGLTMPVDAPGIPRDVGRVRAVLDPTNGLPAKVEGWLTRSRGPEIANATSKELKANAGLPYPTDAAHLFPRSFGGPAELWNLIATSGRFNKSWMAVTENALRALQDLHGDIYLSVEVVWTNTNLPSKIIYRAYKRGDHGGPVLLTTETIADLDPQIFLPLKPPLQLPSGKRTYQPKLNGDLIETWFPYIARVPGES